MNSVGVKKENTKRLVTSAMLIAIASVIALVCEFIPFLNLPFGGGFTVASMLPIVIIAYMYGTKAGLLSGFTYAIIQMIIGGKTVMALFLPGDEHMQLYAALLVCLIDYIIAYTVLGFGGVFRKMKNKTVAIVLGVILALSLRYIAHIVSGAIFYGAWAEWFFTQDGFKIGGWFINHFSGKSLSIVYSIVYNGLYMIPEIVITAIVAIPVSIISSIKKSN